MNIQQVAIELKATDDWIDYLSDGSLYHIGYWFSKNYPDATVGNIDDIIKEVRKMTEHK